MQLSQQIQNVYRLLGDNRIEKTGLFGVASDTIQTSFVDDVTSLFTHRSKRADTFVQQSVVEQLIATIKASHAYKGINHIGFCYLVESKEDEIKRIIQTASGKNLSVYQEPSNDAAAWLFVGDLSDITNPLLEFLPVEEPIQDKWVEEWLPHIQIDIDTGLDPAQIKTIVQQIIKRPFTPYPISIDGITYIQRVNLGCVEGVNIMLDIATNNRSIDYRKTWPKLG